MRISDTLRLTNRRERFGQPKAPLIYAGEFWDASRVVVFILSLHVSLGKYRDCENTPNMNQFEYLIPFVGIIYALSATDLLVSSHRIIVHCRAIRLHIVPILWAVIAFLLIINGWWGFILVNDQIKLENAGQLFCLSLLPVSVFLIASLSLPHSFEDKLDMWEYFNQNKLPFYCCHAGYLLLIPLVLGSFAEQINYEQVIKNIVMAVLFLSLIKLKHWAWHGVGALAFFVALLQSLFNQSTMA